FVFLALVLLVMGVWVWGVGAVAPESWRRRWRSLAALGALGWAGLFSVLAFSGLLQRWELRPPPFALVLLLLLVGAALLSRSSLGERLAKTLPLVALVGFQAFRLPLELVMHQIAREGVMPVEMSFSGYNFDILTGASALVVAALLWMDRAPRWLMWAWNLL